jgi:hypothetical protein
MKILMLGNAYWRTDFQELGHEVLTLTPEGDGDLRVQGYPASIYEVLEALPYGWNPDLVLTGDASTYPLVLGLEFLDLPLVWYAIDSHIHLPWHRAYAAAFDVILVAQKDYRPRYVFDPCRQVVEWYPLFCDPRHDRRLGCPKIHALSFVGTLNPEWNPERVRLMKALRRRTAIHVATGEYVRVFNESKVVLNQCAGNDVNFRTFQALACGSLLLMERVGNGLGDLFEDRTHLVLYDRGDAEQITALSEYYNAHEDERERIAATGRAAVLASHTGMHRARGLLEVIGAHDVGHAVALRKARLLQVQQALATVYEHAARMYGQAADRCPSGSRQWEGLRRIHELFTFISDRIRDSLGSAMGGAA